MPGMSDQPQIEQVLTGDERAQLEAFVADNRAEVEELLDGLTEEQARQRLVPSQTCLLGIVKHCAFVERVWFDAALEQRTRTELGLPEDASESWVLADDDTIESVLADFRAACAGGDAIAAQHAMTDLATGNRRGPLNLRWIYLHLIEEYARHAGHGDILREQILARL